jgi:type IV pilus assembly protein PilO
MKTIMHPIWPLALSPDTQRRLARGGLLVLIAALPAWGLGQLGLGADMRELARLRGEAQQAREDYRDRLVQGQALAALRAQRAVLHDSLWPPPASNTASVQAQAWTETLLRDLQAAGRGQRLRFELFRPGATVTRPRHLELPFTLRVAGTYRELGAFVAALAAAPQLVVVDRLALVARGGSGGAGGEGGEAGDSARAGGGLLVLELTARAYRWTEAEMRQAGVRETGVGRVPGAQATRAMGSPR